MSFTVDIPTPLNLPNTAVKRDNNSEFSVSVVHGNLDGNATTSDDGVDTVVGSNGLILSLANKKITGSIDPSVIVGGSGNLTVENNGAVVGQQPTLNLIAGSNASISTTNDTANNRISVTISSTGQIVSATNLLGGTGAVAVYKQTASGVLQFRQIAAASNMVDVSIDATYDQVDVDIVPENVDHQRLEGHGELTHDEIDAILADLSPPDAASLDGQPLAIYNATTTLFNGYLSQSNTAHYKSGDVAGSNVAYIIKNPTFSLQTPTPTTAINLGDTGTLDLYINGTKVDSFNLAGSFNETYRAGSQIYPSTAGTSPNNLIQIQSVSEYNGFRTHQKLNALVLLSSSVLEEGYNGISLVHNMPTSQTSLTFDVFYDDDNGPNPSITTPTLSGLSQTSSKYLSGIRFASINDTIFLGIIGSNLFNNVYNNQPITYSGLIGVVNDVVGVTDGAVTGISNPPIVGQTMTVSSKTLTFTIANVCSNNGRITCFPRDPYGTYTSTQSSSQNLLISTYGTNVSNGRNEFFADETYRLPLTFDFTNTTAALTGNWTSSSALTNNNAQQYFFGSTSHGLVYPTINYTGGYVPAQTGRNYSSFSGDQKYARAFAPSINQTSVVMTFNGVSGGIGNVGTSDVNIEIKLPGQTGWLDAAVAYDSGAGVGSDGLGCLNGSISYSGGNATLALTFGGKTTGDAGGRMYLRVTLKNTNRSISSISTNW